MLLLRRFRYAIPVGLVALTIAIVLMATSSGPDAETTDLATIAASGGVTLEEAVDIYGWQNDLAAAVGDIREAFPADFSESEITGDSRAKISFAGAVPSGVIGYLSDFTSRYSHVTIDLESNTGWTEASMEALIPAVHYAVMEASSEIEGITTEFDSETGVITTTVALSDAAPASALENLQDVASQVLIDQGMNGSGITVSVVKGSAGRVDQFSSSEHRGGETLSNCTSGFAVEHRTTGETGMSTAGHCNDGQSDDGQSLSFREEYIGYYGDFQWHAGPQEEPGKYYAGNASMNEADIRSLSSVEAPMKNQTLCSNGKESYKNCHKVKDLGFCAEGACNLVRMKSSSNDHGDSGGPVYYALTAYGLNMGVDKPLWPIPWPKYDIFSRADLIDNAMKIRIRK